MPKTEPPKTVDSIAPGERISYLDELGITLSSNFDVTSYINSRFPDETLLETSLEQYLVSLQHAIARADAHLSDLIRSQSRHTRIAAAPLSASETAVRALQAQLATLAESAERSETAAREAIEPARPLYAALRNTSAVRETLDALVRLDESVAVLEAAAQSRSLELLATDLSVFASVRNALEELTVLDSAAPSQSRAVKRLSTLRSRALKATDILRETVVQQFRAHAPAVAAGGDDRDDAVETLQTVCLVGAAIGDDVRAELVSAHVASRVAAFRAAFMADETGLSGVERRFAWLRKELRANWKILGALSDKDWGLVFPAEWEVGARLSKAIVSELRDWTEKVLDKGGDSDVGVMVSALGKSKAFEDELERRFGGRVKFGKAISESYGPWMGAYVEKEDGHLAEVVRKLVKEETWRCEDGNVLNSAKQWFLAVKKSMKMCAALDSRQPLYLLHTVFKKHLGTYASHLVRRLPGNGGNALADSSKPKEYENKIERACAIISTSDYCANTVRQLEENIAKIVDKSFASDIDMNKECETFATVAAKGVHSLVALLDEDLHLCLKPFRDTDWTAWPNVGDTSPYVSAISLSVHRSLSRIRARLSKHHFRFLLDKFGSAFVATFASHVYKTDNMSHFGAQQLLLDTSALRTLLVSLPEAGSSHGVPSRTPAPTMYVKNVSRELAKIEAVLKVILAPIDTCIDTYLALVPGGNADAFRHILDMRGVRRGEAAPLVLELTKRLARAGPSIRSTSSGSVGDLVTVLSGSLRVRESRESIRNVSFEPEESPPKPKQKSALNPPKAQPVPKPLPAPQGSTDTMMEAVTASGAAAAAAAGQASEVAVDSMKNFFGRFGNLGTSFKETGIADRLGQVTSSIGNSTSMLTKEAMTRLSAAGNLQGSSSNGTNK